MGNTAIYYSNYKWSIASLVAQMVKNLPAMQETWVKKVPWRWEWLPLQYSCLENPMDRGADFTFTFYFHALEKEMATHSSVLAWRILGTGELDGLPSMGSHRVGQD